MEWKKKIIGKSFFDANKIAKEYGYSVCKKVEGIKHEDKVVEVETKEEMPVAPRYDSAVICAFGPVEVITKVY